MRGRGTFGSGCAQQCPWASALRQGTFDPLEPPAAVAAPPDRLCEIGDEENYIHENQMNKTSETEQSHQLTLD